jgi:hypothetical protein
MTKQNTVTLGATGWAAAGAGYLKTKFFGNSALFATQTDFICGVDVVSQTGNNAIFGVRNALNTAELSVQFTSPNKTYRANDATATSVAGDFTDGEAVYVARDAGNKLLISDTTTDNTTAQAATTDITLEMYVLGRNNNGSVDLLSTATLGFFVYGKRSVIGGNIHNALRTLITNW